MPERALDASGSDQRERTVALTKAERLQATAYIAPRIVRETPVVVPEVLVDEERGEVVLAMIKAEEKPRAKRIKVVPHEALDGNLGNAPVLRELDDQQAIINAAKAAGLDWEVRVAKGGEKATHARCSQCRAWFELPRRRLGDQSRCPSCRVGTDVCAGWDGPCPGQVRPPSSFVFSPTAVRSRNGEPWRCAGCRKRRAISLKPKKAARSFVCAKCGNLAETRRSTQKFCASCWSTAVCAKCGAPATRKSTHNYLYKGTPPRCAKHLQKRYAHEVQCAFAGCASVATLSSAHRAKRCGCKAYCAEHKRRGALTEPVKCCVTGCDRGATRGSAWASRNGRGRPYCREHAPGRGKGKGYWTPERREEQRRRMLGVRLRKKAT